MSNLPNFPSVPPHDWYPADNQPPNKKGLAIAAGILGGIALLTSVIPVISFLTWLFVVAAVALAITAMVKKQGLRPLSIIVLCTMPVVFIVAVLVSIATIRSFAQGPSSRPAEVVAPEDVDPAAYSALTERDLALMIKNPDSGAGEKVVVYARVTQFDAATGECYFRASIAHEQMEDDFDYDDNALFQAGDGRSNCELVEQVVSGDILKIWASGLGSESYDTQIGGSTTVPLFQADLIEPLSSAS